MSLRIRVTLVMERNLAMMLLVLPLVSVGSPAPDPLPSGLLVNL